MDAPWISTKAGPGYHEVEFAYAIRYLNIAYEYLVKREEEEGEHIRKYMPDLDKNSDWPAHLSDWKIEQGVRKITDYQARRFAASCAKKDSMEGR